MTETVTPTGLEARPPQRAERTPAEIEADIERTRERLAWTVDEIAERVKPANVARRLAGSLKGKLVDERGRPRVERIAVLGGVAAAVTGLVVWRKSR